MDMGRSKTFSRGLCKQPCLAHGVGRRYSFVLSVYFFPFCFCFHCSLSHILTALDRFTSPQVHFLIFLHRWIALLQAFISCSNLSTFPFYVISYFAFFFSRLSFSPYCSHLYALTYAILSAAFSLKGVRVRELWGPKRNSAYPSLFTLSYGPPQRVGIDRQEEFPLRRIADF